MNEHVRPDPDALLASIHRDEQATLRGRLKIFFGMAAGVGKTYAMLKAARQLKAKGVTVVVGLVETHGREETEALLEGLTIIPRTTVDYRGVQIREMDLDSILRSKPAYVLVDELAHTNAEGMRHKRRFQDVVELLDNGINVYTTLNVQHVESLVDTVQQISGVTVRETVPDNVLDEADEIELIDLAPDELIQRLSDGKVYTADRSAAAINSFFRKGNLTALREIALRRTAQRVDLQLKDYMRTNRISGPWKTVERLIVAVGPGPHSERIIRWTRRIASTMEAPWVAVYVQTSRPLLPHAEKQLKKNIALAQELGAELVTTEEDDIVKALVRTARQHNASQIVVGKSMTRSFLDLFRGGSLVDRLIRESGGIDVYVVQSDTGLAENTFGGGGPELAGSKSPMRQYFVASIAIVAAAIACFAASSLIDYRSVGMFFLFIISVVSLFVGRGPIFVAAFLGATIWDFFFIPPLFTFSISHVSDLFIVSLFFIVALVTGTLTSRVRAHETAARRREEHTNALYSFVNELSGAESADDIARIGIQSLQKVFGPSIVCYPVDSSGALAPEEHPASTFKPDSAKEQSVAQWVYKNQKPAGSGTDTLPFAKAVYYPLLSPGGCGGVIGLAASPGRELTMDKSGLLQMFLHQMALALERIHMRSERLNKTLLNSISHELRTPLATITGAASSLCDPVTSANAGAREILVGDIRTAASNLDRLVENLLDMTRIESGGLKISEDWCDVRDLFNSVAQSLGRELSGRAVNVTVAPEVPLVKLDTVLIEQALANIVLNAIQNSPENTAVFLQAGYEQGQLLLTVEDEGKGFPAEAIGKIFEKFYRVPGSRTGGTGLGLSIVKGFVEAHGGTVEVGNRPAGGASFTIRLPTIKKPFGDVG